MMQSWQLWSGEFTPDLCDSFISNFAKLPAVEGKTFNGDDSHRTSIVRWVHNEAGLQGVLQSYFERANAEFGVSIGRSGDIEMQFTEYDGEHQGQYKWHHDIDWTNAKTYQRKLSMVINLTDPSEYDGGDLKFSEVENPVAGDLRARGSVIVFPSYLQHCVEPVTKGKRHSLVCWLSGKRWK